MYNLFLPTHIAPDIGLNKLSPIGLQSLSLTSALEARSKEKFPFERQQLQLQCNSSTNLLSTIGSSRLRLNCRSLELPMVDKRLVDELQ